MRTGSAELLRYIIKKLSKRRGSFYTGPAAFVFTTLFFSSSATAFECTNIGAGAAGAAGATDNGIGYSIACGPNANANGDGASAIGPDALANQTSATAVGVGAQATGLAATAVGPSSRAGGVSSTAVGNWATASADNSTAIGQISQAIAQFSTALGYNSQALQIHSTSIGSSAIAQRTNSTAVGDNAQALYIQSTAYGSNSYANGYGATVIGYNAHDNGGYGAVAVGLNAASGAYGTAIGQDASTLGHNGSTALGANAVATRNYQMMFGTSDVTYTAPGITSANSRSSQSGTTQFLSTDANGNLAASGYGPQDITSLQSGISGLQTGQAILGQTVFTQGHRINANQNEARQGIAMAAAMSQAPMPSAPGKTSWKLNNAIYKNAAATSLSIAHRLPTTVPVAVTAGVAVGLKNSAIVTGGMQGEF